MSGFDYRPKIKDADYYLDAITDVVNKNLGKDQAALLDHLYDEERAAELNGEVAAAGLINHIRTFLSDPF